MIIDRKKKLRLIQFFLLFFGLLAIYLTYYNKELNEDQNSISKKIPKKIKIFLKRMKEIYFSISNIQVSIFKEIDIL